MAERLARGITRELCYREVAVGGAAEWRNLEEPIAADLSARRRSVEREPLLRAAEWWSAEAAER